MELVRRGLAGSREQARQRIEAGHVVVSGAPATKPSRLVAPAEPVEVVGPGPRYVSRGGEKLDAALRRFAIDVGGREALDVGASTGGFTDCLLQDGASSVVALDVGYGQLHPRLREDPRVIVLERTNIRDVGPDTFGGRGFSIVCADLSFISLRSVAPALLGLAQATADLILLVKPQFEAGRGEASRGGGVIRDPVVWRRVLEDVHETYRREGSAVIGLMVSPLTGAEGNVEFLAHLRAHEPAAHVTVDVAAVVDEARAR